MLWMASHHELAPAQHEIDLEYMDGLTAADNIMTFKGGEDDCKASWASRYFYAKAKGWN